VSRGAPAPAARAPLTSHALKDEHSFDMAAFAVHENMPLTFGNTFDSKIKLPDIPKGFIQTHTDTGELRRYQNIATNKPARIVFVLNFGVRVNGK